MTASLHGSHRLSAEGRSQAGPKPVRCPNGRQIEVGARRAPKLLSQEYFFDVSENHRLWTFRATLTNFPVYRPQIFEYVSRDYSPSTFSPTQKFAAFDKGQDFAKNLRRAWTRDRLMENAAEHKQVKFAKFCCKAFYFTHSAECS